MSAKRNGNALPPPSAKSRPPSPNVSSLQANALESPALCRPDGHQPRGHRHVRTSDVGGFLGPRPRDRRVQHVVSIPPHHPPTGWDAPDGPRGPRDVPSVRDHLSSL